MIIKTHINNHCKYLSSCVLKSLVEGGSDIDRGNELQSFYSVTILPHTFNQVGDGGAK